MQAERTEWRVVSANRDHPEARQEHYGYHSVDEAVAHADRLAQTYKDDGAPVVVWIETRKVTDWQSESAGFIAKRMGHGYNSPPPTHKR